jgi:hypothetical protein
MSVGDLLQVADGANQHVRITAIASDTSLTLSTAASFGSANAVIVENPIFDVNGVSPQKVDKIASDTSLAFVSNYAGATQTGGTPHCGAQEAGVNTPTYYHVWIGNGGSGTTAFISTQRTTPYGITGYNTYFRRVGSIVDNGTTIIEFSQKEEYGTRHYIFECAYDAYAFMLIVNSTPTNNTWTSATCPVPPTAFAARLWHSMGANGARLMFRKRGAGSSTTKRLNAFYQALGATETVYIPVDVSLDGSQIYQYTVDATSALQSYLAGYSESLRI